MRCLVGDHVKCWDQKLCQAEIAHNHAINRSTGFSPFQVVYSVQPRGPLDLMVLPSKTRIHGKAGDFVTGLQDLHRAVFENLNSANSKYKQKADHKRRHLEFEVGDFVVSLLASTTTCLLRRLVHWKCWKRSIPMRIASNCLAICVRPMCSMSNT